MAGVPVSAMQALLGSRDYSDFTIKCKDSEFKVHKVILGAGSEYFRALFRVGFKETTENKIDFEEDDPDTIGRVLSFLYTNTYACPVPVAEESLQPTPASDNTLRPADDKQSASPGQSLAQCNARPKLVPKARKPAPTTQALKATVAILKAHVLVYQTEDRLGIPNLVQAAFTRLKNEYNDHLVNEPEIEELVDLIYHSTGRSDKQLRVWVSLTCIRLSQNHPPAKIKAKLLKIVGDHEPMVAACGETLYNDSQRPRTTCQECGQWPY